MGHSSCGCVESMIQDDEQDDNIFITIFKHSILNLNAGLKIDKQNCTIY